MPGFLASFPYIRSASSVLFHQGRKRFRFSLYLNFSSLLTFCLLLLFAIPLPVSAQQGHEQGLLDIRSYTPKDYHLVPQNFAIVQDKRGVIYVGNNSGVLEYDGRSWDTILTPKEAAVHSLAISPNGTIYVGGTGEIGFLKPNAIGRMRYHSLLGEVPAADRDFDEVWKCFATDEGIVYFQSSNKLFRWDGKKIKAWTPKTSFHLMFYLNGKVFVREKEVGLMQVQDTALTLIQGGELFAQEKIYFMLPFRKKDVLLNTQHHGLFVMRTGLSTYPQSGLQTPEQLTKVSPFPTQMDDFFINKWVYNAIRLNAAHISVGTRGSGLIVIDTTGKLVEEMNKNTGLPDATIEGQFLDAQEKLWLATYNGITRVDINSPLTKFNDQNGLDGAVESVVRHRGILYAVTNTGVYSLQEPGPPENGKPIAHAHFQKVPGITSECWDLLSFTNNETAKLLVTSDVGVFQLENDKSSLIIGDDSYSLHRSEKDPNRVFVGLKAGVSAIYWSNGKWISEGRISGISDPIRTIDEDANGTLWLGNNGPGVERVTFDISNHQFRQVDIHRFGTADGLPDEKVYIKRLSGHRYFATLRGIYAFQNDRFSPDSSLGTQFSKGQTGIFRISEDAKGTIWMVTVSQKDGQMEVGYLDRTHPGKPIWKLQPFMGLSRSQRITLSLFHEANGVTWMGEQDCLFRFDENIRKNYDWDYKALVRKVILGKDSIIFSGTNFNDSGFVSLNQPEGLKPKLHYSFNSFTFLFSAPNFEDETAMLFSYYLEGFDKQWSGWKNESKAVYTNLPEGKYYFRVKAMNIFGHESQEAVYEFTVLAPWYRTVWAYIGYVLFFIGFVWGAIIISTRGLRSIIQERTAEVVKQKEVIELKNKDITDSINYAKRIQEAILPTRENFKSLFPESFILFKPKDIVSGDFYWLSEKNEHIYIAAADCTGHGVPGAFTSMIGTALLNEIVNDKGIQEPGKILDALREGIIKALKQSGKEGESKDGMDISLCSIDLKNKKLEYAGAYNPLFLLRKKELLEFKADKFPIGISDHQKLFTNNLVDLQAGDSIYIFSDGYADQFGGPGGKKYMRKRFKDHLLEMQSLPMEQQGLALNKAIVEWQGKSEQVDDILVIGIRI